MGWRLSRFRAGDRVQVRSEDEILATLDENGCIDGMPFMPEMLQYCGKQFHVDSVAHKTCETARGTWQGRRLDTTVHLASLRCDGSAHGGCQAHCKLFWKDEWLKSPVDPDKAVDHPLLRGATKCDERKLFALTRASACDERARPRYSCQATRLYDATAPLKWWDPRQYVLDVATGNHSLADVVRALFLATLKNWLRRTPRGYRVIKFTRETIHRWLVGGEVPDVQGRIPQGQSTPTGSLNLRRGELVRVKSKEEILNTIHEDGRNRGLSFDPEMVRYCGRLARVRASVTNIINEGSGEMIKMKAPCIILDGVVCGALYSSCRLMCPRELPPFWRELWLERVNDPLSVSESAGPFREHEVQWRVASRAARQDAETISRV